MRGRMGRAAAVYAALGLVWWASIELAYRAIDCGDWTCLYYMLGAQALVSVAALVTAGVVLRVVKVRRAVATGWLAAGLVLLFVIGQQVVPIWPGFVPDSVQAVVPFALAGTVAAFATDSGVARRYRVLALLVAAAVIPVRLAWVVFTGDA